MKRMNQTMYATAAVLALGMSSQALACEPDEYSVFDPQDGQFHCVHIAGPGEQTGDMGCTTVRGPQTFIDVVSGTPTPIGSGNVDYGCLKIASPIGSSGSNTGRTSSSTGGTTTSTTSGGSVTLNKMPSMMVR